MDNFGRKGNTNDVLTEPVRTEAKTHNSTFKTNL